MEKTTYIYIYALYAQIYEIPTRCFDLPMLQQIREKNHPTKSAAAFVGSNSPMGLQQTLFLLEGIHDSSFAACGQSTAFN